MGLNPSVSGLTVGTPGFSGAAPRFCDVLCDVTLPGHTRQVLSLHVRCGPRRNDGIGDNSCRHDRLGTLVSFGVIFAGRTVTHEVAGSSPVGPAGRINHMLLGRSLKRSSSARRYSSKRKIVTQFTPKPPRTVYARRRLCPILCPPPDSTTLDQP